MKTKTFSEMGKEELRANCKIVAIKGWGKMNNTQMREALSAVQAAVSTGNDEPVSSASEVVLNKVAADQAAMIAKEDEAAVIAPAVVAAQPTNPERKVQKNRPTQFGVTRPSDGTICADIWTALDKILSTGVHPTTKDLATLRDQNGWQKHTASTQFQRFRQFNGIMPRSTAGQEE